MSIFFHKRRTSLPAGHARNRPGKPRREAPRPEWLAAAMVLVLHPSPAQEALRSSLAGDAAAEAMRLHPDSTSYTVKSGDFTLLLTPSVGLDWNDNINTSKLNVQEDFILKPVLGINASYPLTQRNLLQLDFGIGYLKYFQHEQLSTWSLQSGSGLSFDVFIKDFLINLHDRASYTQDSASEAAVAGSSQFGNIVNTAGLLGTWDLQDVTLNAGYDHANTYSPAVQFQSQDMASELVSARAGLKLNPRLTTGLETTASFTTHDQAILNDGSSYSAGVYADWRPGSYFQIQPRAGYTISQFQQTSRTIQTGDVNSWYAGLTLTHAITDAVNYSLSAGHEIRPGIGSDAIKDWYVRPSVTWKIIKNLSLSSSISYEHGDSGAGNVRGNLVETYDYVSGGLTLSHALTDRLTLGLNYRLTIRESTGANLGYTQNLVGLQLTYQAK